MRIYLDYGASSRSWVVRVSARIKICGMKRPEHVRSAVAAGAHAVGLVFIDASSRCVSVAQAKVLAAEVPPFVIAVGLFLNPTEQQVRAAVQGVALQCLQFHGDETDSFCSQFGLPYIKAVQVSAPVNGAALAARYANAQGIHLDAAVTGQAGGTGQRFDWAWFPKDNAKPWILAGGLNAANVADAIRTLRPYAVDVSSGVESTPGIKDPQRIAAFCDAVRQGNLALDADSDPGPR